MRRLADAARHPADKTNLIILRARLLQVTSGGMAALAESSTQLTALVLALLLQVTSGGMIALAEGATQLTALDVLAADHALGSSCLDYDSCFALAANCSNLQVSFRWRIRACWDASGCSQAAHAPPPPFDAVLWISNDLPSITFLRPPFVLRNRC